MDQRAYFKALSEHFDAGRCMGHVAAIHASDRWSCFSGFRRTARYCADRFKEAGLAEVELLELEADGRTRYGDWVLPMAWDAESAVLRFTGAREGEPPLADYAADPCALMMFSAPTPPGGVEAGIAIVDDAAGAIPGTLKGKLILTAARPASLVPLARAEGAVGILSDHFPLYKGVRDSADEMRGYSRWENDLVYPVNDAGLFGFSLSPENGARLRSAVAEGRAVTLSAEVNARSYRGKIDTVSALIPGSDPAGREILFCAHLYEHGANDNATGCGALLELAAAVSTMISTHVLPRPELGLRFVMGYECAGLMGYHACHPGAACSIAAGINMDMVGASAADRAVLNIWHDPLCNWSFMDTLLPAVAREYRAHSGEIFEFLEAPYSIGDNLLADPSIGVPTVSMIMHPAKSYHSSMDNMSMVDSAVLKRNSVIAGAAALMAAEGLSLPAGKPRGVSKLPEPLPVAAGQGAERIPVRLVKGTLTLAGLDGLPREHLKWFPFYDYRLNCPLFWADGKRSLGQIAVLSAAELGIEDAEVYLVELNEYFEYLSELGYLEFA